MKIPKHIAPLFVLALASLILGSGCADIDITKRRYRPGFHVDMGSKRAEHKAAASKKAERSSTATARFNGDEDELEGTNPTEGFVDVAEASTTVTPISAREARKQETKAIFKEAFAPFASPSAYAKNMADLRAELRQNKFKNAVFDKPAEEGMGWSVVSIIAMPIGIMALVFAIVTLASVISNVVIGGGTLIGPFIAFGILAILLGIAGLILGVIGKKQTKNGKRGKGFALVGMIAGILGMAFGLIFTLWGIIFTFINRNN